MILVQCGKRYQRIPLQKGASAAEVGKMPSKESQKRFLFNTTGGKETPILIGSSAKNRCFGKFAGYLWSLRG